jgi:hypothetical protein
MNNGLAFWSEGYVTCARRNLDMFFQFDGRVIALRIESENCVLQGSYDKETCSTNVVFLGDFPNGFDQVIIFVESSEMYSYDLACEQCYSPTRVFLTTQTLKGFCPYIMMQL